MSTKIGAGLLSPARDEIDYSLWKDNSELEGPEVAHDHTLNLTTTPPAPSKYSPDLDDSRLASPSESISLDSPDVDRYGSSSHSTLKEERRYERNEICEGDEEEELPPLPPPKAIPIVPSPLPNREPRKVSWRNWFTSALSSGDSVAPDQTPSTAVAASPAISDASSTPANDPFPYAFLTEPGSENRTASLNVLLDRDDSDLTPPQETPLRVPRREYLITVLPAAGLTTESARISFGLPRCIPR